MARLQWMSDYSGETVDEWLALATHCRIDGLVRALEQALTQKTMRAGKVSLSEEEQVVLAVVALDTQVNEGGFRQFFTRPSAEYAPAIVDALLRIGCPGTATIAQKAIDGLGHPGPSPDGLRTALALFSLRCNLRNRDGGRVDNIGESPEAMIVRFDPADPNSKGEPEIDPCDEKIEECDQLFYAAREDIAAQLFAFVQANKQAFTL
jgi:hypothetical protein